MEILNLESYSTALSTSYEADSDVNFLSHINSTEEGLTFFREKYLQNVVDRKINNYSSIYLTDKKTLDNIIDIQKLPELEGIKVFNTSLVDNNTGLYLTLPSVSSDIAPYYFTEKFQKFIEPSDRIFEIILVDEYEAMVAHRSKSRKIYYLKYEIQNNSLSFVTDPNIILATDSCRFSYILDTDSNKLSLFKNSSIITVQNNTLLLNSNIDSFRNNYFNINYYLQQISTKLNTSWVSYNPIHKNIYDINIKRSRKDIKNNYLISTQYSYVTGNEIKANILTLKNQNSNKNYKYRSNFIENLNDEIAPVDNRNYTGLFTGNEQEKGDYSITLSYEFYNNDYRFVSDQYTTFKTPKSLYPYEQININDLKWDKMGSIAGENPYLSDKIFQKIISNNVTGAEYLCSWLHKNRRGEFVWLDRFYYPIKTTYATALSSSFNYSYTDPNTSLFLEGLSSSEYYDVPFPYNSLEEEYGVTPQNIKSAVYGRTFYDKISDVVIRPNTEYIYYRVGNNYVKDVIKTIEDSLIQNGLTAKNSNDSIIYEYITTDDKDDIEYEFDNNTYSTIENYDEINKTHEFTISFFYKSNDWTQKNGYQIIGNLNHIGFGVFEDRKITPLITIQNNNKVYVYNTDFVLLDNASLTYENDISKTKIKELYRTDHLDSFYTINTFIDYSEYLITRKSEYVIFKDDSYWKLKQKNT